VLEQVFTNCVLRGTKILINVEDKSALVMVIMLLM
jgi:hypothetical protein